MIVAPEIHTEVLMPKTLVLGGVRKAASGRSAHGFRLPTSRPRAPPAVSRPAACGVRAAGADEEKPVYFLVLTGARGRGLPTS